MKKVLIAEDDRILSKRIAKALEKYADKIEVVLAADGKDAIDILKNDPVSLVVTDVQMPRINGMILMAYLHTYHPHTPCIVMTSYGTSRLKAKLPKDTLRIFQKPFNINGLVRAIIATLERDEPRKDEHGISIVSFLEMIQLEKISCSFEIHAPGKPTGVMYFENGVLYDAVCGKTKGEIAALELVAREMSTYRFEDLPEKKSPRRIKTDLQELIRNAVIVDIENELPMV